MKFHNLQSRTGIVHANGWLNNVGTDRPLCAPRRYNTFEFIHVSTEVSCKRCIRLVADLEFAKQAADEMAERAEEARQANAARDAAQPTRCKTVGCTATPARRVTWSTREDREHRSEDVVCLDCARGYARRPALRAVVMPMKPVTSDLPAVTRTIAVQNVLLDHGITYSTVNTGGGHTLVQLADSIERERAIDKLEGQGWRVDLIRARVLQITHPAPASSDAPAPVEKVTCVIHVVDYDGDITERSMKHCGKDAVAVVGINRKPRGFSYPDDYPEVVGRPVEEPRCLEHLARDSDAFVSLDEVRKAARQ